MVIVVTGDMNQFYKEQAASLGVFLIKFLQISFPPSNYITTFPYCVPR